MKKQIRNPSYGSRQKGAITMFSAVLILILLTEMILYATQVGIFEQRKSTNEMRHKEAFHTTDSAIQVAKQFLGANAYFAASSTVLPDGTTGWLAAGSERWQPCSDINGSAGSHPCFAEPQQALRDGMYFYSFSDDATDNDIDLPLDVDSMSDSPNETVTAHALLCMLDIDRAMDPPVQGCTTDPLRQDERYFMISLMAVGNADCNDSGDNCSAETMISDKIGSFGPGGSDGGPGAPLIARTNVPLSGTVEIVPNPNGGGTGVPISSWVNAIDPASNDPDHWCALNGDPISPDSGSYATCEAHEWYGQDTMPDDYACPTATCSCDRTKDRMLTYAQGNDREMGIDIVPDPDFPCDLWQHAFQMSWQEVKQLVEGMPGERVLTSCDGLDENSIGIYWVSGPECDVKTQVGGPGNPVLLISSVANTKISAGGEIYGVLFVTNVENPGAEFTGNGHATVYGAVIMDAVMEHFNGTFQIVYVDNLATLPLETGLTAAVAGAWTDFHTSWQ